MRAAVAGLAATLALGCARSETPAPRPDPAPPAPVSAPEAPEAPHPARPPRLEPTQALVQRPEVAALVEALAAERKIESSHVGAAGSPSPIHAKWAAVAATASPEELAALLRHESPVVRGYAARHLVRAQAPLTAPLAPLLSDATTVGTTDGCMVGDMTIASLIIEDLCTNAADAPAARALLRTAAAGDGDAAKQAARCLPKP